MSSETEPLRRDAAATSTNSAEVREAFLRHFEAAGHERVPSGPLVPANDPTLMFTNAGMVQFKDVFTGKDVRPYKRATTAQKCIRISGKHNDLENVGVTARHHTFFEMLGNFSFGDYFKEEAIVLAWKFVTGVLGLSPNRLVVTVFRGEDGVPADDEAAALWARVTGFGTERILRMGAKDNFWSMGDTGPCGPCTEIHFWMGDGEPDLGRFGEEPGADGRGWVELWNLVFMQFERFADGSLSPLPAKSVDTGAGLERLTAAEQGVVSNYDTDLLRPIVEVAARAAKKRYGGSLSPDDVSMRVIADHARAAAFLISEGIFPDKDGRSYVLRRVMRRAIRHGHRLGIRDLFFHDAADRVIAVMGGAYPQLVERRPLVLEVCRQEEERFRSTLERGLSLLAENTQWEERDGKRVLPGPVAFKLYDTFGFPEDLQEVIGAEQGFVVDREGFEAEMARAKAKSAGSKVGERAVLPVHHELVREVGATRFVGYERERCESTVVALVKEGARVDRLAEGEEGEILTAETPFYGESGGQVGDCGEIRANGGMFVVRDTQKPLEGLVVHLGFVSRGTLEVGTRVDMEVDHRRRAATRRNHSATHLLHWALRTVIGPSAMQKGSLVAPERLRFDYAGVRPLSPEEIARIEDLVNEKIRLDAPIETEVLPLEVAKARGAIGIFEEKYGDVVRMLRMTNDSIELCGGTHAASTGEIGLFKIVSEAGVAAGVRRIEAVTGEGAIAHVRVLERQLSAAASLLKVPPHGLVDRIEKLLASLREKEREIEELKRKWMQGGSRDLASEAQERDGYRVLGAVVDIGDAKALREMADQLRERLSPAVVLLGTAASDGRALLVCSVSKDLTSRLRAGDIVKDAAAVVGGSGGGRPDFAQAGGHDVTRLAEAVARAYVLA